MVKPAGCSSTPPSSSTSSPTEHVSDSNMGSSSCNYKGVRKRKWGKWVSEIRLPNSRERIWLGSYNSAEKAARAFDAALYCLRGRDAKFNFPESPPDIVQGRSLNRQEIQAVAARFANDKSNNNDNNNNSSIITSNESQCTNNSRHDNVGIEQYTPTTSSSMSLSDGGAPTTQVVESEMMDWSSFLSMLDTNQGMSSEYGFYPGLYPPLPPPDEDNIDDDQNGDDVFSQSSFLWNF